jgi:flagellum-specific peptidoglycan hydrolase FlgJ
VHGPNDNRETLLIYFKLRLISDYRFSQGRASDMTPRKDETPEEFRARLRARYAAADPEYRESRLARQREHRRRRYTTDPVYREQLLKRQRERRRRRYATDPVYREQLLKRQRERYETDPEYRQQIVERERKRYARKRQLNAGKE